MDYFQLIFIIFSWYPIFLIPAIIGSGIFYGIMKNNITINKYHVLSFVFPWLIWVCLMGFYGTGKSLSNIIEAIILGCIVSFLVLTEGIISVLLKKKLVNFSKISLLVSCIAAILLWLFMPLLPE